MQQMKLTIIMLWIISTHYVSIGICERYYFRSFNASDGLAQISGKVLLQDQQGYIWIGTEAGLNRFNGQAFDVFSIRDGLTNDHIYALAESADGRIWIGTHDGLSCWYQGEITNYDVPTAENESAIVQCLFVDENDSLWLGIGKYLCIMKDGKVVRKNVFPEVIRAINSDAQQKLIVGTPKGLYHRTADNVWIKNAIVSVRNNLRCIKKDANGTLYIGLRDSLYIVHPEFSLYMKQIQRLSLPHSLFEVCAGSDGVLWIAARGGLGRLVDGKIQWINEENGLPFSNLATVIEDREGFIWCGGYGGIAIFIGRPFQIYSTADGLASNIVRPIIRDRSGKLWVGTSNGLNYFDGNSWETFTAKDGLSHNHIMCLLEDSFGIIWVGTRNGLNYIVGNRIYQEKLLPPNSRIRYVVEDRDGNIWCTVQNNGLYRRLDNGQYVKIKIPGLEIGNSCMLVDAKNHLWVSGTGGLAQWNGTAWRLFTTADGLASNTPYFICQDQQRRIWFGYHASFGITCYDGKNFKTYTTADGLYNDAVYSIGVDKQNNIWIGSARGLDRFDGERFYHYGTQEGYPSSESNAGGFWLDDDGSMWFGTAEGLSHYNPEQDYLYRSKLSVRICRMVLGEKNVEPGSLPVVKYKENQLNMTVAALTGIHSSLISIRYRLHGLDAKWHTLNGREINYSHLPPGMYRLEIQARKSNMPWSPSTVVSFQILPPFWLTWWFWLLTCLLIALFIYRLYRWRVYNIQMRNRHLEQTVKERTAELELQKQQLMVALENLQSVKNNLETTNRQLQEASKYKSEFLANMSHEIRTPMNGILGLARILLDEKLSRKHREYVEMIHSSASSLLAIINDILDLSKIEAGKMEMEVIDFDLEQCLQSGLQPVALRAEKAGLAFHCHITNDVPFYLIGDPVRLRQVVVNLAGNAIKFTEQGEIIVTVEKSFENANGIELHFQVQDTGIGIPVDKQKAIFEAFSQAEQSTTRKYGGTGLGLTISYQLVRMMGGRIWVDSKEGEGSTFHFTAHFPIHPQIRKQKAPRLFKRGKQDGLIISTSPTTITIMQSMMNRWGCSLKPAITLDDAWQQMKAGFTPAILIVDDTVNITAFLDAREKHELAQSIPALVMTTILNSNTINITDALQPIASLSKPLFRSSVHQVLLQLFNKNISVENDLTAKKLTIREQLQQIDARILLAEDNFINQKVFLNLLKSTGLKIDIAENGKQAVDAVSNEIYDLVFMDVQMPVLDGISATQKIRTGIGNSTVPIVAMTAMAMKGDKEKCLSAGMNDYISKPIEPKELFDKLHKWLIQERESIAVDASNENSFGRNSHRLQP